VKGTE